MWETAKEWGPFAGLLLVVLWGGYRIISMVMAASAERERELISHQREIVPAMQRLNDEQRANTAVLVELKDKIAYCDPRREREKASR